MVYVGKSCKDYVQGGHCIPNPKCSFAGKISPFTAILV